MQTNESIQTTLRPDGSKPGVLEIGIFRDAERAEDALVRLFRAGVRRQQVSLATPPDKSVRFPSIDEIPDPAEHDGQAAAVGTTVGAAVGGAGAVLAATAAAGTVAGLVLLGPVFVGVVTGAVAGGFVGAMTGRGTTDELADYYEQSVRKGRLLLAVEPSSEEQIPVIRFALREAGAEPVELDAA